MASAPAATGSAGPDLHGVWDSMLKRFPDHMSIAVGVDGSTMSDRAASAALAFANTKRGDQVTMVHISDSKKANVPKHLLPNYLKIHYEDMAASSRVSATWLCRDKTEGENTCTSLTRAVDKANADLLVVGSFGRKGEKLDMLGTVSDFTLRESHSSICIVRATGAKISGQVPMKVVFATDGSYSAALAFCVLLHFLRRPQDGVVVVMVTGNDGTAEKAVLDQYTAFMAEHKVPGSAYVKTIDRSKQTLAEGLLDAVAEAEADTLVLGINGYGRKKLGSMSEQISIRATCTTIIIKDSREVLPSRYSTGGALASEVRLRA